MCLMVIMWMFHGCLTQKIIIQKERENELDDSQAENDPMTVRALRECGILKYFRTPSMRAHVHLLNHLIWMWDSDQQHLQVGTHILNINVEDIYFLMKLSRRGSLLSLYGPKGGDMTIDDITNEY